MTRLLGVLVVVVAGWAAWAFVVKPAMQPPAPYAASHPTAVASSSRVPTVPTVPGASSQTGAAVAAADIQARDFLAAWATGHYDTMYRDLSPAAQHAIARTTFVNRYKGIAAEATITGVHPLIMATALQGGRDDRATATYAVNMSTTAVGPISYTTRMSLRDDNGRWGVAWTPDLIFPGLGTGYRVHLYTLQAQRGAIVDRLGQPLAVQGKMLAVGVVPANMTSEKSLLSFLSGWLNIPSAQLHAMIHVPWAQQTPTDLVPIATVTTVQWQAIPPQVQTAQQDNGLVVTTDLSQRVSRRIYPHKGLAAPLLGYVRPTDSHGGAGLERWADPYLSEHPGARLAIATAPDYAYVISTIKERPAQDGAIVHLTVDATLQDAAERALKGRTGAVVAIRPSDGAVLTMASTPGYDPNLFATGISSARYQALVDDPRNPLLNHATLGQYPLGSVFKMVTMGAAMEKDNFTANSLIPGPPVWYGLPGYPKHDWNPLGHGTVTLHEALVQSCDTCFYQIGQNLDNLNHYLLPTYARAWGFGSPTGITGVREGGGIIPDPHYTLTVLGKAWQPGDPVDMAIGQGYVAVTPLQVAQMLAALGNNGVMYRPYVVSRITAAHTSTVVRDFPPVVSRTLPLSPAHLRDILSAMLGVTTEPNGTAASVFAGFRWPVAGKTGTAQTGDGFQPHAWFAALAPATHPTIALVVMVEHGGEGSVVAAPIARQLLRTYFTRDQDLAGTATPKGPPTLNVP